MWSAGNISASLLEALAHDPFEDGVLGDGVLEGDAHPTISAIAIKPGTRGSIVGNVSQDYVSTAAHPEDAMKKTKRKHADDLRAVSKLAVTATKGVTDVVEDMHRTIASGPPILGRPLAGPARLLTRIAYWPVKAVTDIVGVGLDAALARLDPLLGESAPGPEREAVLAALNGVLGDHLADTNNPLAIEMAFRQHGAALPLDASELRDALPGARRKLLVLVHGSSMNDLQWNQNGFDLGATLAEDFGFTPVYLLYNSGLHISTNGRAFARLLERLVAAWPEPIDEIDVLGHSMGGLVARSACHVALEEKLHWLSKLRRLVFLGVPHHGSPVERGGNWIHTLLRVSSYSAPIGRLARIRSAGVTDLRFGNILDSHWDLGDRFALAPDARRDLALPDGVECYAIAASRTPTMQEKMAGDGLVPVDSALGRHERRDLTLAFPKDHQWIAVGTGHIGMLASPEVYEQLQKWFAVQ